MIYLGSSAGALPSGSERAGSNLTVNALRTVVSHIIQGHLKSAHRTSPLKTFRRVLIRASGYSGRSSI
jgi:hypothetical protein